ncbi:MAG: hypothetical protein SWH78_08370 [Thermodesulfobacteriota bacterium]|nr:hypothetical protein [Thermodesulfobacteriota bacterium]
MAPMRIMAMVHILYGMPSDTPRLHRDLEAGRFVLGGCVVAENDAAWQCVDCEAKIYRETQQKSPDEALGFFEPIKRAHSPQESYRSPRRFRLTAVVLPVGSVSAARAAGLELSGVAS